MPTADIKCVILSRVSELRAFYLTLLMNITHDNTTTNDVFAMEIYNLLYLSIEANEVWEGV